MKYFITLALVNFSAITALASPTTCPAGALSLYLAPSFSCTSGNLLFTGFGYNASSTPGVALPANGITVDPQTGTLNEGFQFVGGWSVGGTNAREDSLISFTASCADGSDCLHDLFLFFNGAQTGTGLSDVTENFCLDHALAGCPVGFSGQVRVTNPPPTFNDVIFFRPVHSVSVSKDIVVVSGEQGTAFTSQVVNTFSNVGTQIPEPGTFVLLGAALLLVGLRVRKLSH